MLKNKKKINKFLALSMATLMLLGGIGLKQADFAKAETVKAGQVQTEGAIFEKGLVKVGKSGSIKSYSSLPDRGTQLKLTLDNYFVLATGEAITPKVLEVKAKTSKGTWEKFTDRYQLQFFKVISKRGDFYEKRAEVTEMVTPGEYRVTVTSFVTDGKTPLAYGTALFTILGKSQKLESEKSKYNLKIGDSDFDLKVTTDGDGKGFTYLATNPKVLNVSAAGRVHLKAPGKSKILISTFGDNLYQRGNLEITVVVKEA